MKLQYLGDSRDAFKWDLLSFMMERLGFREILFLPYLTPDDPIPTDGLTSPHRFPCGNALLDFNKNLRLQRNLSHIGGLGCVGNYRFDVSFHLHNIHVPHNRERSGYLNTFTPGATRPALAFADPDNGFETRTSKGPKWILHAEANRVLNVLPDKSVLCIYQHLPRRQRDEFFKDLRQKCSYSRYFLSVYESQLSFVFLTNHEDTASTICEAGKQYVASRTHPSLRIFIRM